MYKKKNLKCNLNYPVYSQRETRQRHRIHYKYIDLKE